MIRASLGELTGLTPAEVQAEFVRRRGETPAAGAELVLRLEPGRVVCLSCEQPVPLHTDGQACAACGSYRRRVVTGQMLAVEGVSIDRSPAAARRAAKARAGVPVPRAALNRVSSAKLYAEEDWDE
jgi:Zn finger protein HypA/HybF involved in hydrogenase expression